MSDIYILTDSRMFTTCCEATQRALSRERDRTSLSLPIRGVRWKRSPLDMNITLTQRMYDWFKVEEFTIVR